MEGIMALAGADDHPQPLRALVAGERGGGGAAAPTGRGIRPR